MYATALEALVVSKLGVAVLALILLLELEVLVPLDKS